MKYVIQFNSGNYVAAYAYSYADASHVDHATRFDSATQASAFIVNHALEGKATVLMLDAKGNVGPLH